MDTETKTYEAAVAALALLSAIEERPMMELRPDGRMEVRYVDVVLMEAPDRGPVRRIEYYRIDDWSDGIEMFRGYLNDPRCPDRVAMLRLWTKAGAARHAEEQRKAYARALQPLSLLRRLDLRAALWRMKAGGLQPVRREDHYIAA